MNPQRLSQRSAIVTRSTSGIGLGIARAFAEQGADVMLHGPASAHEIDRLCTELQQRYGVRVAHTGHALGCPEQVRALAERARASFGKVDIVVNNVEIAASQAAEGALALEVLATAFHLIRAVVPEMKLRRFGRIINVAAAQGFDDSPCRAAYLAARHGMIGLARAVALDGAGFGITARTICFDDERSPPAEEVFALAVLLASEDRTHPTHH